jgi:N-methylhydantoinase A
MTLDVERAAHALKTKIADPTGMTLTAAANGIIRIASTTMAHVVTRVTTERGLDAGDFAMVAYGGAGPLHACIVARELHSPTVVVPLAPGHFSAYGMLMADLRRDFVRTWFRPLAALEFAELERLYAGMEAEGLQALERDVTDRRQLRCARAADMRYVGQEHSVNVELPAAVFAAQGRAMIKTLFDAVHLKSYGFSQPQEPAEIVSLHSSVIGELDKPRTSPIARTRRTAGDLRSAAKVRKVLFAEAAGFLDTPVYARAELLAGDRISGPALVEEYASTTVVFPRDELEVSGYGDLVITIDRS